MYISALHYICNNVTEKRDINCVINYRNKFSVAFNAMIIVASAE